MGVRDVGAGIEVCIFGRAYNGGSEIGSKRNGITASRGNRAEYRRRIFPELNWSES